MRARKYLKHVEELHQIRKEIDEHKATYKKTGNGDHLSYWYLIKLAVRIHWSGISMIIAKVT